jgi:hypothetical protein
MGVLKVTQYQLAVCGCGPASLSPLIYMEENGKLEELLQLGLCIIDETDSIGTGNIGKYHITANSLGKVFTEIFKDPNSPLLSYLQQKNSMKKISHFQDTAPPLTLVGELLNDIGEYLGLKMERSQQSDLFTASRVTKIQWRKDKQFDLTIQSLLEPDSPRIITSKHVLFNVGGKQHLPAQFPSEVRSNQQVWYSDTFLKGLYDKKLIEMLSASSRPMKLVVFGASHSAFSSLYRLQNQFGLLDHTRFQIDILTRKPIRLFYASVEEALLDEYPFDPIEDVCPLSGRVNRFSGLRYDSFKLAKDVLRNRFDNVKLQLNNNDFEKRVKKECSSADIMLVCTGYQKKSSIIVDDKDEPLRFETTSQGTIYTDYNYCPMIQGGKIVNNLYTYGLGTGVQSSVENGGEPSFQAQVHGVWFYQHIVAPRVTDSIMK